MPSPERPGPASLVALGAALALLAAIVFAGRGSPEADSYYHLRCAALIARGEMPHGSFPWASASTWAHAFADKDWLYHVALVPFARAFAPDTLLAGKVATVVFASGLVLALALFLWRRGVPRPGELALLGLLSSYTLLQRVTVARTLTVAVTLLLLLLLALVERRAVLAFVLALVYPLAYTAVHVPLALGLATAGALRLRGERLGARCGVALVAGTLAGIGLHPDFPRNVTLAWDQNARVLANAWTSSRLGREQAVEFRAFPVRDLAVGSFPLGLALGASLVLLLLADRRLSVGKVKAVLLAVVAALVGGMFLEDLDTRALLLYGAPLLAPFIFLALRALRRGEDVGADTAAALVLAGAASLGAALSVRFLEYAAPLGTLALGLTARDALASEGTRARARELRDGFGKPARAIGGGALVLVALASQAKSVSQAFATVANADRSRYEAAGEWLSRNAHPGEVVFHARWDAFPELFYFAPGQRYLVALDPAFLYYADDDHRRYDLWDAIGRGLVDPVAAGAFGSRLLVTDADAPRFQALEAWLRLDAARGKVALRQASSGVEVWEIVAP